MNEVAQKVVSHRERPLPVTALTLACANQAMDYFSGRR